MLVSNMGFPKDVRVYREASSLSKRFEVMVIGWDRSCLNKRQESFGKNIIAVRLQLRSSNSDFGNFVSRLPLFWLLAFNNLIKLKANVVHCHDFDTLPIGLVMKFFNPNVKVIFTSGIFIDMKSELLNEGAKDFIKKPFTETEILRTFRKVLDAKGSVPSLPAK